MSDTPAAEPESLYQQITRKLALIQELEAEHYSALKALKRELVDVTTERDSLIKQRDKFILPQLEAVTAERDRLREELSAVIAERDQLLRARELERKMINDTDSI